MISLVDYGKDLPAPASILSCAKTEGPPARVIVVEDDDYFREILTTELNEHGFLVQAFPDGQTLLASISAIADADVIILDWGLPGTSGIQLLPQIRRLGINLPVVFLTGRALTANEIQAFDRGASDFIDKARGMPILVRRLRRVVSAKPVKPQQEKIVQCGKLCLKAGVSRAYWDGVDVGLTLGEFKIVHVLAVNAGRHITYREIYDCLHYRGFVAGHGEDGYRTNVRSAIKRIRWKFRACDPGFDRIENYTAFGYIWRDGGGTPG